MMHKKRATTSKSHTCSSKITLQVYEQDILYIIKKSLLCGEGHLNLDSNTDEVLTFAKVQQVEVLIIDGLIKMGFPCSESMRNTYILSLMINDQQLEMAKSIFQIFCINKIDYLPIKGCILKHLYPTPEMRTMGDLDILVRSEQYDKIRLLMISNGFEQGEETDYECVWNKNGVHIELHKRLVPSHDKDFYAYYGDGWQFAKPTPIPYRYEMTHEDTFVYLFTHYAKHYRDSGVGIRQALDLYVYRKAYPDLSNDYVNDKMRLLQLDRFYENTMHMLNVWFDMGQHTEASQFISDRLFSSGVFGSKDNNLQSTMLKLTKTKGSLRKAKFNKWMRKLFLPYKDMCKKYGILAKLPILLPFIWLWRWCKIVLLEKDRIRTNVQDSRTVTDESVHAYHEMLRKSGLDFNYK